MILFAPIQGFTDFIYRKAYSEVFGGIDAYFIPYVSLKSGQILKKHLKEILPENNPQKKVVPQVLVKDGEEMLYMASALKDFGYTEINLNLGCPYPMVTNRGKGAGLLPHPDKIRQILSVFFDKTDVKLSVKIRAGLESPGEIENILPVLNEFPLSEIIIHPRIAKQLYTGDIAESAFRLATEYCTHKLVFNGDVFSVKEYQKRKIQFPNVQRFMLGRGILMNPFLPAEIKGKEHFRNEKKEMLMEFQEIISAGYLTKMDNPGNTLNKLKQCWIYFSHNFPDQKKALKKITKTKHLPDYQAVVKGIFQEI